ncbi:MAG: hypothetical protein AABY32_01540 [Nanoarchaeota archaeon]
MDKNEYEVSIDIEFEENDREISIGCALKKISKTFAFYGGNNKFRAFSMYVESYLLDHELAESIKNAVWDANRRKCKIDINISHRVYNNFSYESK